MPKISSPHKTSHQDGGIDEISLTGLAGLTVTEQPSSWSQVSGKPSTFTPAAHKTSHQDGGADEISVAGLSGELADPQPSTFLKLSDTPSSYTGQGGKVVSVKSDVSGLEFTTPAVKSYRGCVARATSAQTIANATWTAINFDTEDIDTDGIHEGVTNPSRLTVPTGVTRIRLFGACLFASNVTGSRVQTTYKNGVKFIQCTQLKIAASADSNGKGLTFSGCLVVQAGDYFELYVYQDSGGNLDTLITTGFAPWFEMEILE